MNLYFTTAQRMLTKSFTSIFLNAWLLCATCAMVAQAQITITSPTDRSVYQRDITGQTTISISGTYTQPIDKVEVRAVPVIPGQGIATEWSTLQNNPTGGIFVGTLRLQGGWYTLEVRALLAGSIIGRDVVSRMGVGEVFMIAGQSNAQGLSNAPGPAATDDRVNYIVYDNTVNSILDPPAPTFAHLESNVTVGPRGQTAWCWGILGDLLTRKLNVPVLFINTAWEGTSVRNWAESAAGKSTINYYGGFPYPARMPYGNMLISTQHYVHQLGVRAILWMQGETDTTPINMSAREYQDNLQFVINKLSGDTGKRINWVIARTSRTVSLSGESITSQAVINGQNAVLNTTFNSTFPGPETDNFLLPRPDGLHFVGQEGNRLLAELWNNSLNTTFFSTITPVTPSPIPALTTSCGTDNATVTLTLPDGYSSYTWSTGQTGKTIAVSSAGTYRATLKDASGNALRSPQITIPGTVRPVRPVIIPGGQQQACADSGLLLAASGGTDYFLWSNGSTTKSLKALQTGNYTVKARNVFGCESEVSAPVNLTVRPALSAPVVEQSGPYSLSAAISETGLNEKYEWRYNTGFLKPETPAVKVTETGSYSARARAVFTLGSTNSLTCYSAYSAPFPYTISEGDGVVIFPNPSRGGVIAIETREDLTNAEVAFYNIDGTIIRTQKFPILNERRTINAGTLPTGTYIVRVRAPGLDVTKRIVID
ncbi:sialate O-acetylesterase [Arundinibacter roseus]|uniref:sialate O-acetylesterase n=1 Tax=Arundinibacter roseus TaxID=2070510 RepID=UPI001A8E7392|nr:sialate O-acetylesterase [Arundinibacter roseus]